MAGRVATMVKLYVLVMVSLMLALSVSVFAWSAETPEAVSADGESDLSVLAAAGDKFPNGDTFPNGPNITSGEAAEDLLEAIQRGASVMARDDVATSKDGNVSEGIKWWTTSAQYTALVQAVTEGREALVDSSLTPQQMVDVANKLEQVIDTYVASLKPVRRSFSDVSAGQWYTEAVYYVAASGLMEGYSGTDVFGVSDPLTRAQMAMILYRVADPIAAQDSEENPVDNETDLPDVENGQWYTGAANWAVSQGVVTGVEQADGSYLFEPDQAITCEEMITMMARFHLGNSGLESYNPSVLSRFPDADEVSSYAENAMAWAVDEGLLEGYDINGEYYLEPKADIVRARTAVFLMRADEGGFLTQASQ